jgi:hypothetical protein
LFSVPHARAETTDMAMIAQGTNNHLLDGRPALQELQFTNDPDLTAPDT